MNFVSGGKAQILLGFLLGIIAAFGQAPYGLPLLLIAAFAAAVWLFHLRQTARAAALFGWAFGAGYFAHALRWIVSPFMVDVERHGWIAPFALIGMAAGMALFWGLAFWASRRISRNHAWPLIVCLPAVELLRAYIFTGFAWAMPSQVLVDGMAGQALALVGPYALNLWLMAGAVALGLPGEVSWPLRVGQGVLALGMGALVILPPNAGPAPLSDHVVRLLQPNAAQRDKWDPTNFEFFLDRHLSYSAAPPQDAAAPPDLVIWSETAIPWSLDVAQGALADIAAAAAPAKVVLGAQRRNDTRYFNSAAVLGPDGAVTQIYDKHHLVPFGEYVPFGNLLGRFGIRGMAAREGFGFSPGPGARLLDLGPLGFALPLICYEAVFAHDVNAAPSRPAFLIQLTNDAWFGKGAGPLQHLAQAQMRAIEQGLPLARAANTGVSAMIDPWGRITASLPLNRAGFIDARLPQPRAPTLYSRTGDLPFAVLLLLGFALAAIAGRGRYIH